MATTTTENTLDEIMAEFAQRPVADQHQIMAEATALITEVHGLLADALHEETTPEEFVIRVGIAYLKAGVL